MNSATSKRGTALALALGLLLAGRPAQAQVTFDAVSSTTFPTGTAATLSHTVGSGSNRVLYVCVSHDAGASGYMQSITYGGVSMTELYDVSPGAGGVPMIVYRLIAPATGTANVSATLEFNASGIIAALSYAGVHQTTPDDGVDVDFAENSQPSNTVSSATNDLVVDCMAAVANAAVTQGAGQTERLDVSWAGGAGRLAASEESGATSVTMSWTLPADDNWVNVSLSLNPAGGGGGSSPSSTLTLLGVGR